jgi:hypothetical protein
VVCGDDKKLNRRMARNIEATVGPCVLHERHPRAGPFALPHYHQKERPPAGTAPDGHSFYEVDKAKARKKQ